MIQRTSIEINKAQSKRTLGDLKQSHQIMPFYTTELLRYLQLYLASSLLGAAKIKPVPAKTMMLLPLETVAHYTVKVIVNNIGTPKVSTFNIFTGIAKLLEMDFNLQEFKNKDKNHYKTFTKYINESGYQGERKTKITRDLLAKYHKEAISSNLAVNFLQLAQLAVHMLADCQPMVNGELLPPLIHLASTVDNKTKLKRAKTLIVPADWFLEWIRAQVLDGNLIPNYYTAMVEPPKPWENINKGGFYTIPLDFIKRSVEHTRYNFKEMSRTVEAVNTLQETPWQVNQRVLEVMNYAYVNRLNWGEMPVPEKVQASPYPYPHVKRSEMTPEQLETTMLWVRHKAAQHDEEVSTNSKYLAISRIIGEAKRFSKYPAIYFTYQVDFRGRIYPVASYLHPQGSQHVKSLLHFKHGKKITTKLGEAYLALQGANTYGQDKIRLQEKLQWVQANHAEITASAQNPIAVDFWKQADEPWLFLAFCFEWADYKKDPQNFESRLPIALDGSCNGLQHLSAMLCDEVGGRAVNLTANYNKEDIYNEVRLVALRHLAKDDSALAAKVREFGIERSTTKRPVMIVPYAGTQNACRKYIEDDMKERGGVHFFGTDFIAANNLITKYVWQGINEVILKGREIMQWFKDTARIIIKHRYSTDLEWTTPNGFRVIQRRLKKDNKQIQTNMGEKVRLTLSIQRDTKDTDVSGHTTAVSPNFIHSLDACALQETVLRCKENGIVNLAMIHDSYGCHAEYAPQMARYLREVFVEMYSKDILGKWISEQPVELQKLFPELPTKGALNLQEVLDSEHFFA